MNNITTWQQGKFIDQSQYSRWTKEMKTKADADESHNVRPSPTGNAICYCHNPVDSQWIASQLNKAAKLDKIMGKLDEGRLEDDEAIAMLYSLMDANYSAEEEDCLRERSDLMHKPAEF